MLPPVQALSRTAPNFHDSATEAALSDTAMSGLTSDSLIRVDREGGSAIAGRINNLLLNSRESVQTDLAQIADLVGQSIGLKRDPGETDAAFAQRFATALANLDDGQRARLQTQLTQALKGLQIEVLLRVLQNTDGPEAALLSAYMEIKRNNSGDLKALSVVSSYSQNGAGPSSPPPPQSAGAPPASGQTAAPQMVNPATAQPVPAAGLSEQSPGPVAEKPVTTALAAQGAAVSTAQPQAEQAAVVAQTAQIVPQPEDVTTNRTPSTPMLDGTQGEETPVARSPSAQAPANPEVAGRQTPLQAVRPEALAAAMALVTNETTTTTTTTTTGAAPATDNRSIAGNMVESETVMTRMDDLPEETSTGLAAKAATETGLKAPAFDRNGQTGTSGMTGMPGTTGTPVAVAMGNSAAPPLATGLAQTGREAAMDGLETQATNRAYGAFTTSAPLQDNRQDAIPRRSDDDTGVDSMVATVLSLKGWMDVTGASLHPPTTPEEDADTDLLRQMFFQTEDMQENEQNDLHPAINADARANQATLLEINQRRLSQMQAGQMQAHSSANQTPANEAQAALVSVRQEEITREQAILSLAGAQAIVHASVLHVPPFVPFPVVSYLAVQDEPGRGKTESVDAIEALGDDDAHQDNNGQHQRDGSAEDEETAEEDGGSADETLSENQPYALSDDVTLETVDHTDVLELEPEDYAAPTLALAAPHEDALPAEALYWRIADLA
ncbi:hypothetical protein G6L63_00260 [Agrobacterium vitis]|uniref:Uncharacterized protein n=1 Tax=Agrobacterium vitis TaxID=373 RepID=A0A368NXH3_AGRVI|nr:hypothetical protein [Agrobacterium vitis]KAA3514720.1 hypothetical protein DXM22_13010 [Agrobacterium vitis]KAA3528483.1 hypothetical protein DXT89_10805 [Agrobacterium vitis]MCF1477947.1 hypothetical protein [Agrobacterium vitis]MUZ98191.1 hypothetical protein [Agrobacterium vitis]MVA31608.1 hypothetical protein [Agrobacterium vitis]